LGLRGSRAMPWGVENRETRFFAKRTQLLSFGCGFIGLNCGKNGVRVGLGWGLCGSRALAGRGRGGAQEDAGIERCIGSPLGRQRIMRRGRSSEH